MRIKKYRDGIGTIKFCGYSRHGRGRCEDGIKLRKGLSYQSRSFNGEFSLWYKKHGRYYDHNN